MTEKKAKPRPKRKKDEFLEEYLDSVEKETSPEEESHETENHEASEAQADFSPTEEGNSSEENKKEPIKAFIKDQFVIQTFFEKNANCYVATVPEIPTLRVEGTSREEVLKLMDEEIVLYIDQVKKNGGNLPDPIYTKNYPAKFEVALSQSLFRKIDMLSRVEKVSMEQLVAELLSYATEKRNEPRRNAGGGEPRRQFNQNHGPRHHNREPRRDRGEHRDRNDRGDRGDRDRNGNSDHGHDHGDPHNRREPHRRGGRGMSNRNTKHLDTSFRLVH
jgi:predicted RNase H-like HicB family nuclease